MAKRRRGRSKLGGVDIVTRDVYIKVDNRIVKLGRRRIAIHRSNPSKGVIVKDGRPVIKRKGKWIYYPK